MRIVYYLVNLPFLLVALLLYKLNIDSIKDDLSKANRYLETISAEAIPERLVTFLEAAEDHRYRLHNGIDFIAIFRAIYIYQKDNIYQGASTIEQQFIRVVTNRYERSLWRKIREQWLALLLDFYIKDKNLIAKGYLYIAFYGSGLVGINEFCSRKKIILNNELLEEEMLKIVSRLKYPEPLGGSEKWSDKMKARVNYVSERYQKYFVK